MLDVASSDWRSNRREAARTAIVEAAWELAREDGLAGFSLRDLARRLGMAAPSLYSYFDSKNALYDAMYADGWRALLAAAPGQVAGDLETTLRRSTHAYVQFALDDPVRYQLLNQRTVPGFEPSPEAYAVAVEAYEHLSAPLAAFVEVTQADLDLLSAVIAGLVNQQIANDPGGTRWVRLIDDAVDLLLPRLQSRPRRTSAARGSRPAKTDGGRR